VRLDHLADPVDRAFGQTNYILAATGCWRTSSRCSTTAAMLILLATIKPDQHATNEKGPHAGLFMEL
jgi:hypothetical protein